MRFSIEFSPPKDEAGLASRQRVIGEYIEAAKPQFISLTCGAGGTETRKNLAFKIIDFVRMHTEVPVVAHLPHSGRSRVETRSLLREFREAGAEMVLALRGDPPQNGVYIPHPEGFRDTAEFVADIKQSHPEMPVYVAGYPEKHPDSATAEDDIAHLKKKIEAGAEMVLEQFCLDERIVPAWHKKCVEDYKIKVPLVPVVISMQTPKRIFSMSDQCNVSIPDWVRETFTYQPDVDVETRVRKAQDFMYSQLLALEEAGEEHVHICGLNSPSFPELLADFAVRAITGNANFAARFG